MPANVRVSQAIFARGTPYKLKWMKVKEASWHLREDESITVDPFRVFGVVVHNFVEQNVGGGGQSPRWRGQFAEFQIASRSLHGGARMARVGLECGIDLE